LKKENLTLHERNETLSKELDALQLEHKETTRNYLKYKDEAQSIERRVTAEQQRAFKKMEKRLGDQVERLKEDVNRLEEETKYKNEEIAAYKEHVEQLGAENERVTLRLHDIEDTHDRQMRSLRDELDIAQHQSDSAYAMETQMKQYRQRLELMNSLQSDLTKYKELHSEQCAEAEELKRELEVIPSLKQQIEKYKSQMIEYKVRSIGAGNGTASEKQLGRKLASLEDAATKLKQENEELELRLKTSRKEIISLQSQVSAQSNELAMTGSNSYGDGGGGGDMMGGVTPDIQRTISRLESENKRLRASVNSKGSMDDLMDELDTKSRLLSTTERRYEETKRQMEAVQEELANLKRTSAEWMRNSCSPQQYQNTLEQLKNLEATMGDKSEYIDKLKVQIDGLREERISASSKITGYEGELNRVKTRYRDLFEYAEQQKQRLGEYKKALSELQSTESKEKSTSFEAQKYFKENEALKAKMECMEQEVKCVQSACMNLLKRQLLLNHNMLSHNVGVAGGGKAMANVVANVVGNAMQSVAAGRGTKGGGKQTQTQPLTVDKLNEFNNLQKKKEQQVSRQNAFISRGGNVRGASGSKDAAKGRGRGEAAATRRVKRPSTFSFRK